jgi:preprotein translocase subunit SecE
MAESKNIKSQKKFTLAWFDKAVDFLREAKTELSKVVWPPRKTVLQSTGVVLVLVIIAASFLGLVDFILARIVRLILGVGA